MENFSEIHEMESEKRAGNFDDSYERVETSARVAIYDDLLSSPQIIDIEPDTTREFINSLATAIYNGSHAQGGSLPFSIILQVAENFIHARFTEVVVSVLDGGNTIRFADQGPGISDKEKAQQPGYSSATAPMKRIINGVGSGLPIVREYMETKHGTILIEDNIDTGAVITISLNNKQESASAEIANQADSPNAYHANTPHVAATPIIQEASRSNIDDINVRTTSLDMAVDGLSRRAFSIMKLFEIDSIWGVKDISDELNIPLSSTHSELKKLEEAGMITKFGKKRVLTDLGVKVLEDLA